MFTILWTLLLPASAGLHLHVNGWPIDRALWQTIWPYAVGGLVGAAVGVPVFSHFIGERRTANLALFFVCVAILTIGATLLAFYLPYRAYFAEWHADFLSVTWGFQTFFTGLGTAYLFLSTGLRPLLPVPIIVLFGAAIWFSRRRPHRLD